jgi:hypothetical protein
MRMMVMMKKTKSSSLARVIGAPQPTSMKLCLEKEHAGCCC